MSRYPHIDLDGATVAITGGAQGIGRATAEAFGAKGAHVAIGDLDLELAQQAAAELGGSAHYLDVRESASWQDFLDAVTATHDDPAILVNNAGVMPNGGFLELDEQTNRLTMEVNLFGAVNGMQQALPGMLARGCGHIVNVASLAGKFPVPGLAMYCASKYAVVGLTAATRREYSDSGVSISAVLPSAVDTELASGLDMKPIPKVKPEAIANAVLESVASRKAETPVPSYVGGLADAATLAPEPLMNTVRSLIRDKRALAADSPERSDYRARLRDAAGKAQTGSGG